MGNPIPAGTGNQDGSANYNAGDTDPTVDLGQKTILPGSYHWDTDYSSGTEPKSLSGANDAAEKFAAGSPSVANSPFTHVYGQTKATQQPAQGTSKAAIDKVGMNLDRQGATGQILDALKQYHVSMPVTIHATDELCYIPGGHGWSKDKLPASIQAHFGKDPLCGNGVETGTDGLPSHDVSASGDATQTNDFTSQASVVPTDFGAAFTGWTPGTYYWILRIKDGNGRSLLGATLSGSDPQVRDEMTQTNLYGYTQVISTDKQMSNRQGTIVPGADGGGGGNAL